MKLDRELQRKILLACEEIYPAYADPGKLAEACGSPDANVFVATLAYLAEHGLIACTITHYQSNDPPRASPCAITARGLDFLADDGGLTAILGTVVVKLHAETIRDMLLAKAEASALPAPEKSALRKQIKDLPAAVLRTLTTRAAQEGLAHVPDLWHWIRATTGF